MLILTGKNLGERHREFNQKVVEAATKKTALLDIKPDDELTKTDIDVLFQMDLASNYKNTAYIIQMLKSGNSLYVMRALKCSWIYHDKYMDIINPNYLQENVFPWMSRRMKKKTLSTISLHIQNEERFISFYSYCMSFKLRELALKFLIYAPESFKLEYIKNNDNFKSFNDKYYVHHFIGSSLVLATAYVEKHSVKERLMVLNDFRYLYFEFKEDYLNMLEKYAKMDASQPNSVKRLGIRISRDILKHHKNRLWNNAVLYINLLNKSMLVKYLSSENVRELAKLLLPEKSETFWSIDFYHSYKFILDLIPSTDLLAYLKNIYQSKYKDDLEMELNIKFFNLKYYKMLTVEEQESWALLHVKRDEELLGSGNDFIWYKFVRFDKAFDNIKQYVFITPDNDKRAEIVNVLVYSAKSQEDLTKLLNYYFERHVNESDEYKIDFLNLFISTHNVYDFTTDCWTAFEILLYSLEIFSNTSWEHKQYAMISMVYHVLNDKELSEDLQNFFESESDFKTYGDVIKPLSAERKNTVIKYWLDFQTDRLRVLMEKTRDDKVKQAIIDQIHLIWNIIWGYERDKTECPEIALNFMKLNMNAFKNHPILKEPFQTMSENDFLRLLKNDCQEAVENVSKVKCNTHRWSFRLNRFLRKLKVYFSHDVAEIYLKYFLDLLETIKENPKDKRMYRTIKMVVVGIFQLGSEELKTSFLEKNVPVKALNRKFTCSDSEATDTQIDPILFQVQKAICRLAYLAQPPVELKQILRYLVSDYVKFCLPLFNNYLVNLPTPRVLEFIHKIIDSPVSLQKHGLRLAFKCFSPLDLVEVIVKLWKKTKNVSMRMLLYKTLFTRIVTEDGELQKALYEVLKFYTSELDHQDHEDVFDLLWSDDMPERFRGDYVETAWLVVSKLSNKKSNLVLKNNVICHMLENIHLVKREFIREHIVDIHVRTMVFENGYKVTYDSEELGNLIVSTWHLTAAYIVTGNADEEILNNNLELTGNIFTKCMEAWNESYDGALIYRYLVRDILFYLDDESCSNLERYINSISIYRCILEILEDFLPKEQNYERVWFNKLSIKSRRVLGKYREANNTCTKFPYSSMSEIADAFAKRVGKIVRRLLDYDEFYRSFYSVMADALGSVCETMSKVMNVNAVGFKILVCRHLTQFKILETHALAIMVLPRNPPDGWQDRYNNTKKMIKQFGSAEIIANVHKPMNE